jgi:hypothetical protein
LRSGSWCESSSRRLYGRPARFATERLEIETDSGEVVVCREGLEDFQLTIGSGDVAELSAAVSIAADDLEGVAGPLDQIGGWAGLYAAGYDLERQPAILYRWKPGTTFERARVVLRGIVQELSIGGPLEPLEFTVARAPSRESRTLIAADAKVDLDTWPVRASYEVDENILGAWYPLIIGYPGGNAIGLVVEQRPRTPGLLVENADSPTPTARESRLLVAGHRVDADEVLVHRIETGNVSPNESRPVFEVDDGLGRTVSVVDFDGSSLNHELGDQFYVSWSPAVGKGGGLPRLDGSGPVRGLGEVIRRLLEEFSDLDVDGPAMESESVYLDRFKIDTFLNEPPPDAWSWIQSELLQLVPVKILEGPNGIWIRLMRYDATARDAGLLVDGDDPRVSRRSKLTSTGWDQVANEIRIDFGANRNAPNFVAHRVVTGRDEVPSQSFFDFRCGVSRRRLTRDGRPESGIRELVLGGGAHLEDVATVDAILRLKAAELAIPHKRASWSLPEGLEDSIRPADTEVGIPVPRAALVDDVTIGGGEVVANLIVLEDPARIERTFRSV